MIFVTVGTHEQQFDRLIKEVDILVDKGIIQESVFIQSGYSWYKPKSCKHEELISYQIMKKKIQESSIVITHGGPGSIMLPLSLNKVPIVVPRQKKFGEHVDDHQVKFTHRLEKEKKVIPIYDIKDLKESIANYHSLIKQIKVENNSNITKIIERLNELTV